MHAFDSDIVWQVWSSGGEPVGSAGQHWRSHHISNARIVGFRASTVPGTQRSSPEPTDKLRVLHRTEPGKWSCSVLLEPGRSRVPEDGH